MTVPRVGSIIARGAFDSPVPGLDSSPRSEWPPVNITHWSFQVMVGIGTLLAVAAAVFWIARRLGRDPLNNRWYLRFAVVAGPLAVICVEAGWVATEVGRQPWAVSQVLRTADAASWSSAIWWSYLGVLVVYLAMTVGGYVVLWSMARRWRAGDEDLPSYGPPATDVAQAEPEPVR